VLIDDSVTDVLPVDVRVMERVFEAVTLGVRVMSPVFVVVTVELSVEVAVMEGVAKGVLVRVERGEAVGLLVIDKDSVAKGVPGEEGVPVALELGDDVPV